MRNLLSANFLRLRKSMLFWGCLILMLLLGAGFSLYCFLDRRTYETLGVGYASNLDPVLFRYVLLVGILMAVFVPLFFGLEYSDGAIRNKLVVGHSRLSIYFANLITGFAASLLCIAGYMLSCLAVGVPLLGWFTKPAPLLLATIAGSALMLAAFCAIFTFVAMNSSKKSTSVVVCLLGVFLLLFAAVYLNVRLEAPEFIQGYEMSVNGEIVNSVPEPNPHYLRGTARTVYQFLYDLLPTGQSLQYTMLSFTEPLRLMGLAAAVTALFSAAGAALFRRKDLK